MGRFGSNGRPVTGWTATMLSRGKRLDEVAMDGEAAWFGGEALGSYMSCMSITRCVGCRAGPDEKTSLRGSAF